MGYTPPPLSFPPLSITPTFITRSVIVFCKDRDSFNTFLALGDKNDEDTYIYIDDATFLSKKRGTYPIVILDDFCEHPDYFSILNRFLHKMYISVVPA